MGLATGFSLHHLALSARDLDKTRDFYERFGFRLVLLWEAADKSLRIAHLALPGGPVLELFEYDANRDGPPSSFEVGNDLEIVGVKHFGLQVDDIHAVHRAFMEEGCGELTDVKRGRTEIDYFFVRDPDGIWVEVVQDERVLDPAAPRHLREE